LSAAAPAYGFEPGLDAARFRRIATKGFGDGLNSYAHSMAWFGDALYIGVTRATLCMVHYNSPEVFRVWPTECPSDIDQLDRRAQIWRYAPAANRWQEVYRAPLVRGHGGKRVARDIGYRGMAVFQGRSDRSPALYVSAWSPARAERPPIILRSQDGVEFEALASPKSSEKLNTYRTLFPFRGNLYTSPTGKTRGFRKGVFQGSTQNLADAPVLLVNSDPATRPWAVANPEGFGDSANVTIFELAEFNGHLYAGTLNPTTGFQIWKTRAEGRPPFRWRLVLSNGAYRGNLNECALSMTVFRDALYVGTGIQNGGYDKTYKVGPAAAEIVRLYPDDSWDLVVGTPRLTPVGYKYPLSGFGPGFDDFFNAYIWRMAVHDGVLYAGTYKWTDLLPYLPREKWPEVSRIAMERIGISTIVDTDSGFDLWRTTDGVTWTPVTLDGFGNGYNYGVRTMVSAPAGLFLGTANPFGPKVALPAGKKWVYKNNPNGGLEVWLGARGRVQPRRGSQSGRRGWFSRFPVAGLSSEEAIAADINANYDEDMYDPVMAQYYDGTDFYNFGYWEAGTKSQAEASEKLVRKLLSFVPAKRGTILDVACGKGATTRSLLRYYTPEQVTGINISEKQLERCRENAPGCAFLLMSATDLQFPDDTFDTILCVEAAFHFNTREQFIHEAYRVLKPGGRLVLSDFLTTWALMNSSPVLSSANYVPDPDEYRRIYERAGFRPVTVVDASDHCLAPFFEHCAAYVNSRFAAGDFDSPQYRAVMLWLFVMQRHITNYVLACAVKPGRRKTR
jgi:ubiquinone/menaquinone biosynthesis C-methylase UbiE